jgi:hypothetical protein
MYVVTMLVIALLPICSLGYGFYALRVDRSSVFGSLLLAIGVSTFVAFFEMWVNEVYHLGAFSRATYFIFPGVVYCLPFLRLERRRVGYAKIIVPFLVGIPVFICCGLIVGLAVACGMGDCV